MKNIQIDNHIIVYDSYNIENKSELQEFLQSKKIKNILKNLKEDVIMVLGGDGTMLEAISKYYKQEKVFLPINFGTIGFLLNNKEFISKKSEFIKREYPLIDIKVKSGGEKYKSIAFNEFIVKDIAGKMFDSNIEIAGKNFLDFKGDGLILSTPAGSTASNFSNHGPILPHSSNSFVMTYLGAYSPKRHPSSIIENDEKIKITNKGRINSILLNADGNEILSTKSGQEVEIIIKKSKYKVSLLIEKKYENKWDNKVLEE